MVNENGRTNGKRIWKALMRKYDSYKESGIDWIGKVPSNWEKWKISHAFSKIGSGTTPESGNPLYHHNGTINWLNTGDLNDSKLYTCSKKITEKAVEDYSSLKRYPSGSLVIAMYGATIGKTSIVQFETTTNQACCVFSESEIIDINFLFYWFKGHKEHIINLAVGGGQPNISQDILKGIRLYTPTFKEQNQIANYLDNKTTQIDNLINKKEQLIELLEEERIAIINQAVTKGLNPEAPMKDSGIEWLGDIPEHWEVWKISHAFKKLGSGTTPESGNPKYHSDGTINWLNTGDLNNGVLESCSKKITVDALEDYSSLKVYPAGSLVIAMYGATIGKTAIVNFETTTNQACCVFTDSDIIDIKFLQYWFTAKKEHIINLSVGGGQPNISQQILRNVRLGAPSFDEQLEIVEYLKDKESKFINLKNKLMNEIELLKEYKTALISEVVTGKVDVRNYKTEN